MIIEMDFKSEEALYIQLRNQIIYAIATEKLREGEELPSVRTLAESIGINMHTVNKAYTVLRQEGFITLDRRKGAVIAVDLDRMHALEELRENMQVLLARAVCKNISREEIHEIMDSILNEFGCPEESE